MNAITIIETLTLCKADVTQFKTATNVLNELYKLRRTKSMPILAIRRAIKIQEGIVKDLQR